MKIYKHLLPIIFIGLLAGCFDDGSSAEKEKTVSNINKITNSISSYFAMGPNYMGLDNKIISSELFSKKPLDWTYTKNGIIKNSFGGEVLIQALSDSDYRKYIISMNKIPMNEVCEGIILKLSTSSVSIMVNGNNLNENFGKEKDLCSGKGENSTGNITFIFL